MSTKVSEHLRLWEADQALDDHVKTLQTLPSSADDIESDDALAKSIHDWQPTMKVYAEILTGTSKRFRDMHNELLEKVLKELTAMQVKGLQRREECAKVLLWWSPR
jgi:hypothetical protein